MKIKSAPAFYIISAGCGDTSLVTLDAISYMAKADAFICPDDLSRRFSRFIGDKPVLFDVMPYIEKVFNKKHPELSPENRAKLLKEKRDALGAMVREALDKGQSIAFLEYGDPTLFTTGIWWIRTYLKDEEIRIVPGVSSFNAANAAIAKDTTCKGAAIIAAPWALKSNEGLIKSAAEQGVTLALFMGLDDLPNLMPLFKKYYTDTTPVALVYYAGYAEKEKVIKTTLKEASELVAKEPEKFMGVLYIGGCLGSDVAQ
jgi:precorrin-4 methylase